MSVVSRRVDPQLWGFASEAAPKPDFQLYYDAADGP